jgi:hypothetical protein
VTGITVWRREGISDAQQSQMHQNAIKDNISADTAREEHMSDNKGARQLRLVDELAEAAKRVGLEVRRERILREIGYRARGGACRLRETDMIIIDRDQPPAEQIEVLAEALRTRDLEDVYLSPAARRVLQTGAD